MTQRNTLNVKLSNLQIKICNKKWDWSNFETFIKCCCCSLVNTQVLVLFKAFENSSSANIKLWRTHLHKIGQLGGILGILLGSLLKTGLSLLNNVLKPLAKSCLIPLGLTAATATDTDVHKKTFGSNTPHFDVANQTASIKKWGNEWYYQSSSVNWRIWFIDKRC